MKRASVILFFLAFATFQFIGCGASSQGVVVTNTISNAVIDVDGAAAYGSQTFGRNVPPGMECFVPAAMYPQSQTIIVTVHAYEVRQDNTRVYIGSRSRSFGFSNSYGWGYYNLLWDVRRSDLIRN
jgi:hypothetical protein